MATVVTFIEVVQEGQRAEELLDGVQTVLRQQAIVGRLALPAIPVIFLSDVPVEVQHTVVRAALDLTDGSRTDWHEHVAVTGPS